MNRVWVFFRLCECKRVCTRIRGRGVGGLGAVRWRAAAAGRVASIIHPSARRLNSLTQPAEVELRRSEKKKGRVLLTMMSVSRVTVRHRGKSLGAGRGWTMSVDRDRGGLDLSALNGGSRARGFAVPASVNRNSTRLPMLTRDPPCQACPSPPEPRSI